MISSSTIYYFSGTGNAKKAASWISEVGLEMGAQADSINIGELESRRTLEPSKSELIGFASPTHGFNFPPIMLNFLWHYPTAQKGQKALIVNTRAGMKMGKFFLPGISGLAQLFAALLLLLKGYKLIAMKPIDLPSNWISLHPGMKQSVVDSIIAKREKTTKHFARKIYNGKRNYRALFDLIQDIAIAPIAVMYYLMGRFILAKTFFASSACINCDLCINKCPVKAIKYVKNRPYWSYKCESCMRCINACPTRAIETAHGFIIGIAILIDAVILAQINKYLNYEGLINKSMNPIFADLSILIINSLVFFIFILLTYRGMYYMFRFKWFEKIVIYTSLTKYKFWRRYKPKRI